MSKPPYATTRWNIFARELEDILARRGLRLGHLNDRGVVYHPEKVRRLQQSLVSPGRLTTLNPEEMERLGSVMNLTDIEQQRLKAALLATAVEMVLMDRVNAEIALMASDDVFNILFAAMQAEGGTALAARVKGAALTDDGDGQGDTAFAQALDLVDRGTLALHVSKQIATTDSQSTQARQAYHTFAQALECLQQSQEPPHESDAWRFWYDEARRGQEAANSLMRLQGGESA